MEIFNFCFLIIPILNEIYSHCIYIVYDFYFVISEFEIKQLIEKFSQIISYFLNLHFELSSFLYLFQMSITCNFLQSGRFRGIGFGMGKHFIRTFLKICILPCFYCNFLSVYTLFFVSVVNVPRFHEFEFDLLAQKSAESDSVYFICL